MNQKNIFILVVVVLALALTASLVSRKGIFPVSVSDDTSTSTDTQSSAGSASLLGKITNLSSTNQSIEATATLLEELQGQDNSEQAAIVDGACTLSQVEDDSCLSSPLYIRTTKKSLTLTIATDADIKVFERDRVGGIVIDESGNPSIIVVSPQDFLAAYKNNAAKASPYVSEAPYRITTKDGVIVRMEERYVP